ncbi:cysteinyl-tRNA synthetase [Microdochium bolleyi]|uniref:cysteine--tRNA ligase n=1 Tax=Microdochium bolleyi TaxID=196109 RepID=A0A136J824_9PEZI|nr:cysteinyl-tRNA synthetase [Microdochium bolleyi]
MDSIKVHNSLKPGGPVPFVPIEKGKVSWYACGPTVYDQSHLGHARNYVSTDIIRRILMHYFGFDVKFVMNFTDVDDKIILRARRNRLLEVEKKKQYSKDDLAKLGTDAFEAYAKSSLPLLLSDGSGLTAGNYTERRDTAYGKVLAGGTLSGEGKPGDDEAKVKMHIGNMDAAAKAISSQQVFGGADEILLPYLDSLYKESVDTSDQSIFTDLTKFMEGEFTDDMDNLNVLRPDVVVRVTEYVPQIAKFVETIVDKGFAYEAEGSVYFDIAAFEKSPGNKYARLRPESRNDKSLQEEGEGSLSKSLGGKRGAGDFALWKKSKAGEPYWPSKWGNGRPGWHIECSVMASDVLGGQMDLHSGGVDLAFPHHDNELAQSEAFYCQGHEHTWVNYFLHMGHLSISGSKMSKSLKNFQTIKDALATTYTARSMRIVFLLGRWNDGVEISPDMRLQADGWESTVNNFFTNVKSLLIEASGSSSAISEGVKDLSLNGEQSTNGLDTDFEQAKKDMDTAMTNSFDTPAAMRAISELIRKTNVHIKEHAANLDLSKVEAVARWVTKIVGILGLDANARPPYDGLGWASAGATADVDPATAVQPYRTAYETVLADVRKLDLPTSDTLSELLARNPTQDFESIVATGVRDPEQLGLAYVRAVSKLRDELRKATSTASPETKKAILDLSDRIRDYDLTNLGVYLDDRPDGQPSLIKFVPAAELIAARDEKAAKEAEKARAKEEAKRARELAEAEKWEKAKLAPTELFKSDERYGEWDDKGMPTKLKDGSAVPKSQLKKLQKDWDRQNKAHTEWQTKFGSSA